MEGNEMGQYHNAIQGTRIDLIAPPAVHPHCARCGKRFHDVRAGTTHCRDCRSVIRFDEQCAEAGIDLAELDDDEFVDWGRVNGRRRLVVRREQREDVAA